MTVFIAHAPADLEAAQAVEKFLERRGLFVELEDGERGFRPLQFMDSVVMLLSKESVFSPWRLRFDQRGLEAWAEQKLTLVKLDHHFAPVGLRDLPAIDASFEAQRDIAWAAVAKQIQDQQRAAQTRARAAPPPASAPQDTRAGRDESEADGRAMRVPAGSPRGRGGWLGPLLATLLILPGLAATVLIAAIWLVNRIGPSPGAMMDVVLGVDAFGVRYGLAPGLAAPLAFGAIALMLLTLLVVISRSFTGRERAAPASRAAKRKRAPAEAGAEPAPAEAVFVSYARANAPIVMPVVEQLKRAGRKLWLDQEHLSAGETWAGEIVRAIRTAEGVCVMCSPAAFESDHVKREVYLADRYKKRLLPVFIEEATPPEDFEYFFAGVQHLKLFETPEAERAAVIQRRWELHK
jgi:hypothetical protein